MTALTRRALLALVLAPAPAAAFAQAAPDPVAAVKALYAAGWNRVGARFHSARLARLFAEQRRRWGDQVAPGLDFDYRVNAQDTEPGYERTLRYALEKQAGARAEVRVRFRNGGEQNLLYFLALERGRWRVDDVRSEGENDWTLSKTLSAKPRNWN